MISTHDSERRRNEKRPRSRLDCLTIVVRSLLDRDHDRARSWHLLEQKLSKIHGESWSYDVTPRNHSHDPCKPPPRPLQWPRLSRQFFSLKPMYSPSLFLNFDRLVKKLSEFQGRSLVHRDPTAFRLDCKAIGAGLILNFSLILSNFPLEFRTSARTNSSKFTSIHENWSLILAEIALVVRFDRLSGRNLSFY